MIVFFFCAWSSLLEASCVHFESKAPVVVCQPVYKKFSEAGVDDYIAKPVDKDDLIEVVERNVSK